MKSNWAIQGNLKIQFKPLIFLQWGKMCKCDSTNSLSTTVPTQSYSSSEIFSASLWVLHCCPKLLVKNHAKNYTRFEQQSAVLTVVIRHERCKKWSSQGLHIETESRTFWYCEWHVFKRNRVAKDRAVEWILFWWLKHARVYTSSTFFNYFFHCS